MSALRITLLAGLCLALAASVATAQAADPVTIAFKVKDLPAGKEADLKSELASLNAVESAAVAGGKAEVKLKPGGIVYLSDLEDAVSYVNEDSRIERTGLAICGKATISTAIYENTEKAVAALAKLEGMEKAAASEEAEGAFDLTAKNTGVAIDAIEKALKPYLEEGDTTAVIDVQWIAPKPAGKEEPKEVEEEEPLPEPEMEPEPDQGGDE